MAGSCSARVPAEPGVDVKAELLYYAEQDQKRGPIADAMYAAVDYIRDLERRLESLGAKAQASLDDLPTEAQCREIRGKTNPEGEAGVTCPDGCRCLHGCDSSEGCVRFRVRWCGPLSGVYANNEWPPL